MKNNMNYKRFRHFGMDKVFMDFSFFAIAFNIKKMCAKMEKVCIGRLTELLYELAAAIFRCWGHIKACRRHIQMLGTHKSKISPKYRSLKYRN